MQARSRRAPEGPASQAGVRTLHPHVSHPAPALPRVHGDAEGRRDELGKLQQPHQGLLSLLQGGLQPLRIFNYCNHIIVRCFVFYKFFKL